MNIVADVVTIIEPWQAGLYRSLAQPLTVNGARGSLAFFKRHRQAFEKMGEAVAAAGAATPIRLALLKLASVDAATGRALARKVKILAAHRWAWAGLPMTAMLIEAAIVADVTALGLGREEERRQLRQLRGEP